MDPDWLWYGLAALLIIAGLAGTILPVLPGVPMVFLGLWLVAWTDEFSRVGGGVLWLLAALTLLSILIDLLASLLGAQRAGATRGGLIGAGIGTIVGLFFGLPGIVLGPLAGAILGELVYRRGLGTAADVGLATWMALLVAAALKLALVFVMLGIFVLAFLW
ncbi:MAG: DUF456 domain-containing protein [Gammaproteobacteria bacterium]|nr:MAG: DUF456 domain-containing protein [Gammaproteobacteria bacterium]